MKNPQLTSYSMVTQGFLYDQEQNEDAHFYRLYSAWYLEYYTENLARKRKVSKLERKWSQIT